MNNRKIFILLLSLKDLLYDRYGNKRLLLITVGLNWLEMLVLPLCVIENIFLVSNQRGIPLVGIGVKRAFEGYLLFTHYSTLENII